MNLFVWIVRDRIGLIVSKWIDIIKVEETNDFFYMWMKKQTNGFDTKSMDAKCSSFSAKEKKNSNAQHIKHLDNQSFFMFPAIFY